jgi:hypothetical protein
VAGERAGRKDRCSMRQVGKRDKWLMRFANVRRQLLSSVVMALVSQAATEVARGGRVAWCGIAQSSSALIILVFTCLLGVCSGEELSALICCMLCEFSCFLVLCFVNELSTY